jgi:hypothetical protein
VTAEVVNGAGGNRNDAEAIAARAVALFNDGYN